MGARFFGGMAMAASLFKMRRPRFRVQEEINKNKKNMITKLKEPVRAKTVNQSEVTVTFLTVRQVIDDPLLMRVSVLFVEAPFALKLWEEVDYDNIGNWTQDEVDAKINKILSEDTQSRVEALFVPNQEELGADHMRRLSARRVLLGGAPNEQANLGAPGASPTVFQQATALGKSLVNWTSSGFPTTPPDELAARMQICKACSEWDEVGFGDTGRCKKCGCSTQAKLRMATEKCPIDKWGPVEPEKEKTNDNIS